MDEMNRIVLCKHCRKPEYYGEFRWLSGWTGCRDCYKEEYRTQTGEIYEWNDLDGKRPTMEEYEEQRRQNNE